MTAELIRENIKNGVYKNTTPYPKKPEYKVGHVFDRKKTVEWNEDTLAGIMAQYEQEKKKYDSDNSALENKFSQDVKDMLKEYYGLNDKQADKVEYKAWEDGHSSGLNEVLSKAEDYGELAEAILKLK